MLHPHHHHWEKLKAHIRLLRQYKKKMGNNEVDRVYNHKMREMIKEEILVLCHKTRTALGEHLHGL